MKNTYQNSQSPSSQSTILVEKINLTGGKKLKEGEIGGCAVPLK